METEVQLLINALSKLQTHYHSRVPNWYLDDDRTPEQLMEIIEQGNRLVMDTLTKFNSINLQHQFELKKKLEEVK